MLPADAQPLLDEEAGAPSSQLSRSLSASSAGRKGSRKGSRAASSRDWGESSYTDLHSLASGSDDGRGEGAAPSRNALGTINGVYVPCLLNIIGVILFLRLGWGVGQAGVEGMMWIFFMAEAQAVLTVLSASTIASNGAMQGGGSYYLISRSLGPEFGGAVGLQFYFLYAVGVSMYLVGFAEEFQQTWFPDAEIGKKPVVVIVATIALILILIIAIIGARAFTRVNKYLFVLQFACVAIGAMFIYVGSPRELKSGGEFTGMRIATLKENTPPHLTNELHICGDEACTIAGVYAIVFPLATGFMEGLNLSGDLQNPGKSIPVGTLAAVGTSCVVYITLILTFAASFTGMTLRTNFSFFQEVSDYPIVVIVGVLVSCFSSALGALFGASRILQAIARDDLFPVLKSMGQGTTVGDEPRNAVLFTAALTQVFICLGDLDVIAPICTSFFCLAYAAVNMTCFLLQVTGVPNFRPSFRYHSWQLALLGAILNIGVMIYLNALYAAVSLLVLASLFFYLYVSGSPKAWGDISQALIYHQVRKYLLRLDSRKAHTKYWRPSILLLTNNIDCDEAKLCNKLKKGGLYIVGSVITGTFDTQSHQRCTNRYNEWLGHIFETKLKAIPEVIVATEAREGYRILMQSAGLGGMQINTVVVPWIEAPNDPLASKMHSELLGTQRPLDFVGLLADGIVLRRNMVIARHTDQLDRRLLSTTKSSLGDALPMLTSTPTTSKQTIDVWVTASWGDAAVSASTALLLQLAYVLYSNPQWRARTSIRLLKLSASSDAGSLQLERQQLERLAEQLRVDSHVTDLVVVPAYAAGSASPSRELLQDAAAVDEVNLALQRHSRHTALLLLPLPDPTPFARESQAAAEYLARLTRLTASLPSTLLAWRDDDAPSVISVGI